MEKVPFSSPVDYSLAIKNRGHPSKSWRWEISAAGKSKPVRQSEFLKRCPKRPAPARRHWQDSGPARRLDGRYWRFSNARDKPNNDNTSIVEPTELRASRGGTCRSCRGRLLQGTRTFMPCRGTLLVERPERRLLQKCNIALGLPFNIAESVRGKGTFWDNLS